jgi:ribosome-binding factor A
MKNTGDGRRVQRVEREIQNQIASFILSDMRGLLPGLVTVARVMMPGDLRSAKVYISVLGTDSERETAVETLNQRAFEVQRFIGASLKMRFCPKLKFFVDDTTERVLKIERILKDLEGDQAQRKPSAHEDDGDQDE